MLTSQERSALSAALKTTLRIWGDSEDRVQERVRGRLQAIVGKLDNLGQIDDRPEFSPHEEVDLSSSFEHSIQRPA
jgi:hypothetical protein